MIIKQLETKYGIKGKTAVHRQAWKEAYVGLANRDLKEYHYVVFISAWFGNLCRTDINIGKDRN
jgi:hypothetical protein